MKAQAVEPQVTTWRGRVRERGRIVRLKSRTPPAVAALAAVAAPGAAAAGGSAVVAPPPPPPPHKAPAQAVAAPGPTAEAVAAPGPTAEAVAAAKQPEDEPEYT